MLGMAFGFLSRVIIARLSSPDQFGIFSIGLSLTNTFAGIAMLGLQQGTTRYIAFYRGKGDNASVLSVIRASAAICTISSVIAMVILYACSDILADKFLHNINLSVYLKVFSCSIGFIVLSNLLIAIFRGADRPESKAIFDDIMRNSLFLVVASIFLLIGYPFISVVWAHLLAAFLTFAALLFFYLVKPFIPRQIFSRAHKSLARKELVVYSLPLLAIAMIQPLFASLDSLILGYFYKPHVVGYYNAIYPIASLIPVLMSAAAFTFFSFFCQLYAKSEMERIGNIYKRMTKLLIICSFPLFLVFFIFPKSIISLCFGQHYISAYAALRVIVLAAFLLVTMGPTDIILQTADKTKFLMYAGIAGFIINIGLNLILIPWLGIIGAAVAYLLGRNMIYLLQSIKINNLLKMHFFDYQYVKLLAILVCFLMVTFLFTRYDGQSYVAIFVFLGLFLPLYFGVLVVLKFIGQQEWDFLNKIVHGKMDSI
jgi:O-antigen/teichoic acid export membrane protein